MTFGPYLASKNRRVKKPPLNPATLSMVLDELRITSPVAQPLARALDFEGTPPPPERSTIPPPVRPPFQRQNGFREASPEESEDDFTIQIVVSEPGPGLSFHDELTINLIVKSLFTKQVKPVDVEMMLRIGSISSAFRYEIVNRFNRIYKDLYHPEELL